MSDAERRANLAAWFYGPALAVVAFDQITKALARAYLSDRPVTIVPGFFTLNLAPPNPGAAFGLLPDWAPLFIIVTLVAVFAIVKLRRAGPRSRMLSLGLGLLLGGSVGNLIDRLTSPAMAVTDFLSFGLTLGGKRHDWPTFNIADCGIVIGAVIVIYFVYVVQKRSAEQDTHQESEHV